jgi:hypothetical protein
MTVHSAWLLTTGQTCQDTRLTQAGATLPADPLKVRSGILPGSTDGATALAGFALQDAAGMSATVQPGRAVIQGMATQGAYPVTLSEATPLTFADGDAQFDRVDLVCLRVHDASYADDETTAALEVIEGTPDASAAAPPTPAAALPLYAVPVPAGTSAGTGGVDWTAVQDLRVSTVATGGILPVYGNAAVPGSYVGQLRDLDGVLQRWDGTAWVSYPQTVGGIAPAGTATGGYPGQYRDAVDGKGNGRLQRWNGTTWQEPIPSYVYRGEGGTTAGTTTSTGYVASLTGLTDFDVPFTAPASGAVMLRMGARLSTSAATATAYLAVALTQGSTTVRTAADDLALIGSGAYPNSLATEFRLYGLTPGLQYTAALYHRSSAATATASFRNRYLRVEPSW